MTETTRYDGDDGREKDFVEKLEHFEPGYGEERSPAVVNDIKDEDNPNVYHKMCFRLFISLTAMSFLWVGSQIPLYLYGSVLPLIYSDLGGANGRYLWMVIGYLIPVSALCPFVGALSDLFGRRPVAMFGQLLLIIGPIVVATAHKMNTAIGGMVLSGLGAGLNELIALAGTSELVPVRKRGLYVGLVVFTILPFCPSALWAQLIAKDSSWRWVGMLVCIWNFVGLLLVAFFYKDPARNVPVRPRKEILGEVDYIGGLLSTAGVICFMMGMQWGAAQYKWKSVHVLVPFFIGVALIISFFVWETFAPHPMCPRALFSKDKRTMVLILFITFLSGGNFFAMLLFWPTQVYKMYGPNPVGAGIRTLPIGFGIIGGAVIALVLIAVTKGRTTILMIFWTSLMTAFVGAVSVANLNNLHPTVFAIVTLASIGVGAVIIPCSIIAQIVAPTNLIGTITAITLSIRYIGGAIGFTVYYNLFYHKFFKLAQTVGYDLAVEGYSYNITTLTTLVTLAADSEYAVLKNYIATEPTVLKKATAYDAVIHGVEQTFVFAYRWPYWVSIAFGGACVLCSFGLRDVRKFM